MSGDRKNPLLTPVSTQASSAPGAAEELDEETFKKIGRHHKLSWIFTFALAVPVGFVLIFFVLGWVMGTFVTCLLGLALHSLGSRLFPASKNHGTMNYRAFETKLRLDRARSKQAE